MKEAETARSNLAQDLGRLRLELEKVFQAGCAGTQDVWTASSAHTSKPVSTCLHISAMKVIPVEVNRHLLHLPEDGEKRAAALAYQKTSLACQVGLSMQLHADVI